MKHHKKAKHHLTRAMKEHEKGMKHLEKLMETEKKEGRAMKGEKRKMGRPTKRASRPPM